MIQSYVCVYYIRIEIATQSRIFVLKHVRYLFSAMKWISLIVWIPNHWCHLGLTLADLGLIRAACAAREVASVGSAG